jgi:hypothetical protein
MNQLKNNNMSYRKLKLSLLTLVFGLTGKAQISTNATGGDATGTGGSVAYSVGQIVYTTNTGATGQVSQGVQQPYEIFSAGMNETETIILLSIFPNPTLDQLTLQISDLNDKQLSYQLLDIQGKILKVEKLTSKNTQIEMSNLPVAFYIINVYEEAKLVQMFRVNKI